MGDSRAQKLRESYADKIGANIGEFWRIGRGISRPKGADEITVEQFWILRYLYESGPKRIKDIATNIGTTSSPVTISVKRMERRSLVTRVRSKDDERVVMAHITQKGTKLFTARREQRQKMLSPLFEILNEREKIELLELLQKVLSSWKSKNRGNLANDLRKDGEPK